MYEQEGDFLDETALLLGGPAQILMGPLNLYDIYVAVARARNLAGFGALPPIQTPILPYSHVDIRENGESEGRHTLRVPKS
jgi:hypothetical protein